MTPPSKLCLYLRRARNREEVWARQRTGTHAKPALNGRTRDTQTRRGSVRLRCFSPSARAQRLMCSGPPARVANEDLCRPVSRRRYTLTR